MATSGSPLLRRGRRVAFFLAAALAISIGSSRGVDDGARDRATALARALHERGINAKPEDVQWVDPPRGVWGALGRSSRAVVRAVPPQGDLSDIYLVDTELSPEGVLLAAGSAFNLTDTSGAEESRPILRGQSVAYVSSPLIDEASPTVHVLDLAGHPSIGAPDWSRLERAQSAITSYQQTGQIRGVAERVFAADVPAEKAAPLPGTEGEAAAPQGDAASAARSPSEARSVEILDFDGKQARVRLGPREVTLSLVKDAPLPPGVRAETSEPARPPTLVQWSVDRVRNISWVGDDTMQTIKAVAFTALDFVMRNKESVTGDTGAEDIAADLGKTELDPPTRKMQVDPEIGWPPPPLEPWVVPALPGEGQWNPRDNDPFVRRLEGLPAAFLTTFIRSDRTRKATRVYVALWDPRQVELHMMAGTVEPKGATGEAGPGIIPRTPEVMKRVVAASNAGFQALHGEFGMMADGVVYLPPKPYAATVAVLRDGTTAFGTWPEKTTPIPENILSYRQNMTVMVQDEKWNPYGRTWWGGTPPGWEDKTHTVRTGICMTKEAFVAYFYGADIGPEALAQAMIQTRCKYGIALDMNAGHSGLEFYKVAPASELEPLGRPLQNDWEAEGDVPGLDGWKFRGRRLIRGMGLMSFPRYIKREARDYFYMTLRPVLPGPAITPGVAAPAEGEGQWRVKGLPQHGFPYAVALAELRPEASRADLRVRVLAVDPRMVSASPASASPAAAKAGAPAEKTVAILDAESPSARDAGAGVGAAEASALWHSTGSFSVADVAPVAGAVRLATGSGNPSGAVAAAGVRDEDGMLLYVEITPRPAAPTQADGLLLESFLKRLGCSSRLLLAAPLSIALGGDTDLTGAAVHPPSGPGAVRLTRVDAPGAKRVFEDTPIVPFDHWYKLQQHRIRYFKKPKGERADDASGSDEP